MKKNQFKNSMIISQYIILMFFSGLIMFQHNVNAAPAAPETTAADSKDASAPVCRPSVPVQEQTRVYRMDEASLLNAQVHDIAIQLIENMSSGPDAEGVMGIATFVDLNNLYRTSPFGRYLAEQLMGEMQRAGFQVVEVRKTESILIKEHYGEYSMSREIEEVSKQTSAATILLGTYLEKGGYVFVNARLVATGNNMIASSAMKIMRRDGFLRKMLRPAAAPQKGNAVRIPVKAFGEPTEVRIIQGS